MCGVLWCYDPIIKFSFSTHIFFLYRRCNMSVRISCYLNFILSFFCELRSFACNPFASFCDIQNVYHMRESISSVNSSFRDNKRKNPNFILLIIATRLVVILKFLYEKECGAALSMCRWKCLFLRWKRDSCIQLHYILSEWFCAWNVWMCSPLARLYSCSLTWITVYKQVFPWAIPFCFCCFCLICICMLLHYYQESHKIICRHFFIHTTKMR